MSWQFILARPSTQR